MKLLTLWLLSLLLPAVALAQPGPGVTTVLPSTNLSAGFVTATGGTTDTLANWLHFGTSVGSPAIGPLIDYQSSGLPGLLLSNRTIISRATTASNDYADLQLSRTANYTGGTFSNINAGLRVMTTASAGAGAQEWNIIGICTTAGTAGGLCLGSFSQGVRLAGATDRIWGSISDAKDETDVASSSLSGATVGEEIDVSQTRRTMRQTLFPYGVRAIELPYRLSAIATIRGMRH